MANVIFEDFTIEVQGAIDDRINAALEECAGELESQVKRNTRVDTGKTKNSFQHKKMAQTQMFKPNFLKSCHQFPFLEY